VQPSIDHMEDLPLSLRNSVISDIIEKTKQTRMELQSVMWEYVGIVQSTSPLKNAEWKIGDLESE
jgi:L-aspartate oxidase